MYFLWYFEGIDRILGIKETTDFENELRKDAEELGTEQGAYACERCGKVCNFRNYLFIRYIVKILETSLTISKEIPNNYL